MLFYAVMERDAARALDLAEALDLLRMPLLLFDDSGLCVELNGAAERFLVETEVLRWDRRRNRARDPAADAAFGSQPISLDLDDTDGRKFAVHVLPLTGGLRD